VTPSKLKTMPFEEARKTCLDYTVTGLKTISQLPRGSASKPLRFIYTSGSKAVRDESQKPWILGDYSLMRVRLFSTCLPTQITDNQLQGETESRVLDFAKESNGAVEACITKPGLIGAPGRTGFLMSVVATVGRTLIGLPKVEVSEIAATLLEQVVKGIEKETLLNDDLIRIGQKALAAEKDEP
jgi:hypothetical protein